MSGGRYSHLWSVLAGPLVWLAHFLVTYAAVALWCARYTPDGSLGPLSWALGAVTVIALGAQLAIAWHGFKAHRHGFTIDPVAAAATAAERERFLAFATWLLAGLSFTATVYVALPLWYLPHCH